MSNTNEKSYAELHRPASSFENRDAYLEHELEILNPKRWKINLPLRDYRFEWEDLIPRDGRHHRQSRDGGRSGGGLCRPLGPADRLRP